MTGQLMTFDDQWGGEVKNTPNVDDIISNSPQHKVPLQTYQQVKVQLGNIKLVSPRKQFLKISLGLTKCPTLRPNHGAQPWDPTLRPNHGTHHGTQPWDPTLRPNLGTQPWEPNFGTQPWDPTLEAN